MPIYQILSVVMLAELIATRNMIGQVQQNKLSAGMHINGGAGMERLFQVVILSLASIQSGETMKPIYSQEKGRTGKLVWPFKSTLKVESKQDSMRMKPTPLTRKARRGRRAFTQPEP